MAKAQSNNNEGKKPSKTKAPSKPKAAKPVKNVEAPKVPEAPKVKAVPDELKVLSPERPMTEKKLQGMVRRGLQTSFLLVYDFIDLLKSPTGGHARIEADASRAVCPPGYTATVQAVKLLRHKGKQVTLEIKAKLRYIPEDIQPETHQLRSVRDLRC